jgi:hypothetical protein
LRKRDDKVLIVSNYSYYYSSLEEIYRDMLKEEFPDIRAISGLIALPYLERRNFDRVVLAENASLDPGYALKSRVNILSGVEAERMIDAYIAESGKQIELTAPSVQIILLKDGITMNIDDTRSGSFLRCLYHSSYVREN